MFISKTDIIILICALIIVLSITWLAFSRLVDEMKSKFSNKQ